jgi:hypothetical protein
MFEINVNELKYYEIITLSFLLIIAIANNNIKIEKIDSLNSKDSKNI